MSIGAEGSAGGLPSGEDEEARSTEETKAVDDAQAMVIAKFVEGMLRNFKTLPCIRYVGLRMCVLGGGVFP
jgi:hypothetical protein